MSDLKQQAALAAVKLVNKGDLAGFGAGATIAHLVDGIRREPGLAESISVVTSSFSTRLLLESSGFTLREMGSLTAIDLYFDGCDQFDRQLNALKSGGGIHTREKILASMAEKFVLIGDMTKRVEKLDGKYPLVVEVIPDALAMVRARMLEIFRYVDVALRLAAKKDGAVITENGNYLLDCRFEVFPDPDMVNDLVKQLPGVLEHSLFFGLAQEAIIAGPEGVRVVKPE